MIEKRSTESPIPLEIYTDGSLRSMGRQTFGGWAFIAVKNHKKIYEASGAESDTTNQRMELKAIYEALKYAKENRLVNESIFIYSDSAYAINCYEQEWYVKWQMNGWTSASKQPVANRDLWDVIIPFFDNFWYHFCKVKGHTDNFWNIQCDKLAQDASMQLKINWRGKPNE